VIFVVDATDRERIDECRMVLEKIVRNDIVEGVPMIMLANKQDIPGALKLHEIKEIFNQIAVQLEARDSKVLCVSALTGYFRLTRDGVQDAVEWLHTRLLLNKVNRPPIYKK
jgi:ADP-ribosylation factor related protein 1